MPTSLAGEGDLPEGWTQQWRHFSPGYDARERDWENYRPYAVANAIKLRELEYADVVVQRRYVGPNVDEAFEEDGES